MSHHIRLATTNDLTALAEMYAAAFNTMHPQEHWTADRAAEFLQTFLKRQPDLAFVAEQDGLLIGGFFSAIRPWWDGNWLVDGELWVDRAQQRHGVGKQLLAHGITSAIDQYHVCRMEALTFGGDTFPLSWYRQLGFRTVDDMVIIAAKPEDILAKLK